MLIKKVVISNNDKSKAVAFFAHINKKKDELRTKIESNLESFKKELIKKKERE